ncbi:6-carboxytetrahydropterin synthase [Balneatrix alpica]|uniref:6-carboxytetrahydropterin synthase n=1 Tax=Balneatrix alpica TaxID=75684 RepID=UPI002739562C|nr:6-carboxytetrahydropterin synthase [Balneatrix alpica]
MSLILFVDNLSVLDCSIFDPERGLIGESWQVNVRLHGQPDWQGMLLDFSEVKKRLKKAIDASLDHTLLLPTRMPGLQIEAQAAQLELHYDHPNNGMHCRGPAQAFSLIDCARCDAQSVAAHLRELLLPLLPNNLTNLEIELVAEPIEGAYYHYSHGLKKHEGNCQRIAHGHRSRILVFKDGQRAPDAETEIAQRWQDIYLVSREDISGIEAGWLTSRYQAAQGEFAISLPLHRCDILDCDTTVEYLSATLAERLHQAAPQHQWQVQAFEGIGKGAISLRQPA